jgi:rhodanese-related sulfurtransferase
MDPLLRSLLLLGAGAALGLLGNGLRPGGVSITGFQAPVTCAAGPAEAPAELEPTAAAALCGRPDVVIADVRSADSFARGHVAGALHLPCRAGSDSADQALAAWQDKGTLLIYGESTEEARLVAEGLARRAKGHAAAPRLLLLRGGFGAWSAAGLACASGPCDQCAPPGQSLGLTTPPSQGTGLRATPGSGGRQ